MERAEIKDSIKEEVGLLKQEFNFMVKENEIKNEIILEQKEEHFRSKEDHFRNKQDEFRTKEEKFRRKEEQLKEVIRDLS